LTQFKEAAKHDVGVIGTTPRGAFEARRFVEAKKNGQAVSK
jgi:hypothetical protein